MGGKLYNLPRMPRADYLEREGELRRFLDLWLGGRYRIPRFYGDKPDFGDMDVLVESRPDWGKLRLELMRELNITEFKTAGHVFSVVYRGLQTDFFSVPQRYLESTYIFMSFNDLGNLLGRMVRRFDLKYGEHGLSYVYRREGGHYKADLELTEDFRRICAFLGLDYGEWEMGFDSLEALFEWTISSPYFSVAPYLDDLSGSLERRMKDRPTIQKFISWLEQKGVSQRPHFEERKGYLPLVIATFPEARLEQQIALERKKEAQAWDFANKFSGNLVMRLLPELKGKALGEFIVALKASVPHFQNFVLETEQDALEWYILEFSRANAG
ncbi:MAG: hypothetical protein H7095_08100 [Pseudopedobacter sp.]|nr:hypothetical protein [Deinococcales bacterium]